ncbi:MAG TPA: sulfotransferase family 2 domain-containing protein [Niabella sp.]|nr:sulfotransferase family 2 domain-containing protein [Bacteroidia bacterium]HOZ91040.1 sulfotransferase family 2 domain-containing protein [Bacteroidia bacterium]HRB52058.1 sulfotransferase family 2 domain-containing protein [Bacteroidia bacterium]HRC03126.1 sulfotransferase family 2 domain-containing protein [Niabella sp.]
MITHDYKLIYIHIPKCAGRSITDMFNQRFDHCTAQYYQNEYPRQFKQYDVFTIVRNPYDRYVSMWNYIKNHRRHQKEDIYNQYFDDDRYDFKHWLLKNIFAYKGGYPATSAEGGRGFDDKIGSAFWFSSQYSRLSNWNKSLIVPNVFHFEKMDEVYNFLSERMEQVAAIPHLNQSKRKEWTYYYDDEIIEHLHKFQPFLTDIEKLGYELLREV